MDGWKKVKRNGEMEFRVMLKSRRLAGMLAEVWQSLPLDDRNLINDRLMLVSDASTLRYIMTAYEPTGPYGAVSGGGEVGLFVFLNASKLGHQPASFVRHVIAHELGHVYCNHRMTLKSKEKKETEADAVAAHWGYPHSELKIRKVSKLP